jgi:hypothetical protein
MPNAILQRRPDAVHPDDPESRVLKVERECIVSIDTIEVFTRVPQWPRPVHAIAAIQDVYVRNCYDRRRNLVGYLTIVHQPTPRALALLKRIIEDYHSLLCRVDVAYDFVGPDPEAFKEWLVKHVLLKYRRQGFMLDIDDTTYFVAQRNRKRRSAIDLALYPDNHCKVTGEVDCSHAELRFLGSRSCRRAGFETIDDVVNLNPAEVFARYLRVVDYDIEALIQNMQRAAVKDDRAAHRGRNAFDPFNDKLRAQIPARVRNIVERGSSGRAQLLHNSFGIKVMPIDLSVLKLPNEVTPFAQQTSLVSPRNNSMKTKNAPLPTYDIDVGVDVDPQPYGHEDTDDAQ